MAGSEIFLFLVVLFRGNVNEIRNDSSCRSCLHIYVYIYMSQDNLFLIRLNIHMEREKARAGEKERMKLITWFTS